MEAFDVVRGFEQKISEYTGAPCVVAVNSCTMALLLAMSWAKKQGEWTVGIPCRTYPSVPMSAYHSGLDVNYIDLRWEGCYQLPPTNIWDCAKRFTSSMYIKGQIQCVSFHARKLLPIGSGGAILHDDPVADEWYRRARFDGRKEGIATKDDTYEFAGWHAYMLPEQAARGLHLLTWYKRDVPDQPAELDLYPDMSKYKWQ